jgi:hypothetical protein
MDFITDLPLANGKDSIFVVVDRLTKMVHFIPYTKIVIGEETAKLFLDNIYCIHRLLTDIVSNWRTQLLLIFGEDFFSYLVRRSIFLQHIIHKLMDK